MLQPAAETFYSFGGEQHLSGNLSKGAPGSDRREELRAPAPVAEIDDPGERQLTPPPVSPYSVLINDGRLDSTVQVTQTQDIYFIIARHMFLTLLYLLK